MPTEIREIKINKLPREKPLVSWPPDFPPMDVNSLGLDLLEVKAKLKSSPPTLKSVTVEKPAKAGSKGAVKKATKATEKKAPEVKPKPQKKAVSKTEEDLYKTFANSQAEDSELGEEDLEGEDLEEAEEEDFGEDPEEDLEEEDLEGEDLDPEGEEDPEGENDKSSSFMLDVGGSSEDEVEKAFEEKKETVVIEEKPPEETPQQKKTRIIRRLRTLKKLLPNATIPDFDHDDDLSIMEIALDDIQFDLKVDQNIAFYKTLLWGYFGGVEFVAGFLDIDMSRFGAQQLRMMRYYNVLIAEIAEKNSNSWFFNLSAEVKLMGLLFLNTLVYFLMKHITKNKGEAAGASFMAFYENLPIFSALDTSSGGTGGAGSTPGNTPATPTPKPKVRTPSVNLDDMEIDSTTEEED